MEQYVIKGGNPLVGEVEIGGAKNSALGILAAAIMCDETVTIRNLPDVNDINVFLNAVISIGAEVRYPNPKDRHTVTINGCGIRTHEVDNDYIRKIRASYYWRSSRQVQGSRCGAAWRMQYRQQTDRPASEGIQGPGCEGMD